mmetsp:Transcript_19137/g.40330  ORF Transcript_19137/g.40330 Transcript_19137/m.40330 type:complete len:235 (-) Transcript_19137:35-739(-)
MAIKYYQEIVDHKLSRGESTRGITAVIDKVKSKRDNGGVEDPFSEDMLAELRAWYQEYVDNEGEDSTTTISAGINLTQALHHSGTHTLECQRLATKLVSISRRVNGRDHQMTKQTETGLERSKIRRVAMRAGGGVETYEAISFDEKDEKYTIIGPSPDGKQTLRVSINDIMIIEGTPVICHGLKNAAHLNGKLGLIVSHHRNGRYGINFEDKSLKSALVKPNNLRILFDLPGEE